MEITSRQPAQAVPLTLTTTENTLQQPKEKTSPPLTSMEGSPGQPTQNAQVAFITGKVVP
jgi:hypothetical protein